MKGATVICNALFLVRLFFFSKKRYFHHIKHTILLVLLCRAFCPSIVDVCFGFSLSLSLTLGLSLSSVLFSLCFGFNHKFHSHFVPFSQSERRIIQLIILISNTVRSDSILENRDFCRVITFVYIHIERNGETAQLWHRNLNGYNIFWAVCKVHIPVCVCVRARQYQ